jgi:hypothetical protein
MYKQPRNTFLDGGLVGDRDNSLGKVVGSGDGAGLTGLDGLTLQVNVDTVGLGLDTLGGVGLDTVDELLTALGVLDVLDADVDALLHVTVSDTLVDNDTEGGLGDVVDDTGLSVVDLVGHTVKLLEAVSTNSARVSFIEFWRFLGRSLIRGGR